MEVCNDKIKDEVFFEENTDEYIAVIIQSMQELGLYNEEFLASCLERIEPVIGKQSLGITLSSRVLKSLASM